MPTYFFAIAHRNNGKKQKRFFCFILWSLHNGSHITSPYKIYTVGFIGVDVVVAHQIRFNVMVWQYFFFLCSFMYCVCIYTRTKWKIEFENVTEKTKKMLIMTMTMMMEKKHQFTRPTAYIPRLNSFHLGFVMTLHWFSFLWFDIFVLYSFTWDSRKEWVKKKTRRFLFPWWTGC